MSANSDRYVTNPSARISCQWVMMKSSILNLLFPFAANRRRNRLLRCPTPVYSVVDKPAVPAESRRPLRARESLSVVRDKSIVPSVQRLLRAVRPFNVSGFVIAIIVDSVNRMLLSRSASNFCNERNTPAMVGKSWMHRNPSASISWVVPVFFVCASFYDASQNPVFRRLAALRFSVCSVAFCKHFFVGASTASCIHGHEICSNGSDCISTLAFAEPLKFFPSIGFRVASQTNNSKPAKRHASQILKPWMGWHFTVYNLFSHCLTRFKALIRGLVLSTPVPANLSIRGSIDD